MIIVFSLIVTVGLLSDEEVTGRSTSRQFSYVGVEVCRECHGEEAIGNQYKIWSGSPHARAYLLLKGEKAVKIASGLGIESPTESKACLKCHTTGGGDWPEVSKEGVGCEACHGPGEEYHTASGHIDYSSRENGYRKAVKLGMIPVMGIAALKVREKLCLSCHTVKRPCYDLYTRNTYKYKIPIQTVDSLMKDDIDFRHPLRR